MFYMYLLKSGLNGDVYVGSCADLRIRLAQHNSGKVKSTQAYRPWTLVYYEAYRSKTDARKREIHLKGHKPKSDLKKQIEYSLKEE